MSDFIITRLPTLVNIDKMSLAELIQQYQILEGDAIGQAQQLSDACAKLDTLVHNLSSMIYALIDSYDAGDQAAILLQVKKLSEQRKDFAAKGKAKVHQ